MPKPREQFTTPMAARVSYGNELHMFLSERELAVPMLCFGVVTASAARHIQDGTHLPSHGGITRIPLFRPTVVVYNTSPDTLRSPAWEAFQGYAGTYGLDLSHTKQGQDGMELHVTNNPVRLAAHGRSVGAAAFAAAGMRLAHAHTMAD